MIKGKHQYAVFNLSEGRLTYHPYNVACGLLDSSFHETIEKPLKKRENGLPRSPPMSSPPPAWWPRPRPQMSANHQTQRPPHLAGGVGRNCVVSLLRCGGHACAKDENVDLVQAEADLIDLILGFRMLKKSNTPSQVKYTGCLDDQLFYSYGQLGEKHQVVAWSCKGRLVQSTAAEHFFWTVEVIMDTPWDSFPKAWGSEWIDVVLSVHASIGTTSVYNHIRWHHYW